MRHHVGFGQSRSIGGAAANDKRMHQTTLSQCFVLSPTQAFTSGGFVVDAASPTTKAQTMVSIEAFFEFVRRRDVESIRYALRDAHYDIDLQDVVSI